MACRAMLQSCCFLEVAYQLQEDSSFACNAPKRSVYLIYTENGCIAEEAKVSVKLRLRDLVG
jgi:hypothetical protein